MQHVREGDLISIKNNDKYYYFLILSKLSFFGCQWTYAFHKASKQLLSKEELLKHKKGFQLLIDFIEYRRSNSIIKIDKNIDIKPFFIGNKLKARIDTPSGGHMWYIYSLEFKILKKQRFLMPWQKSYPITSGINCNDAFELINKKWTISQIVKTEGKCQYPLDRDV